MAEITKATLADEDDVAGLIKELGEVVGVTGGMDGVSWYNTLEKMLALPEWNFLLARSEGDNVGLLVMMILPSLYHAGNTALVTELIVTEKARGKGVGSELVEEAKRIARARGCEELIVSVEVESEQAIGFYNKLGFERKHANYGMSI
jgi:ribosomal protein S18 acetylase RimI-like enzyme